MSKRSSIIKALASKLAEITTAAGYKTDLYGNAFAKLKFWDEIQDFPAIYMTAGSEMREYLPSAFTWGYLGVSIKVYTKGEEDAQEKLELLLEDIENVIDSNRQLLYDSTNSYYTTEILINSITTDEGLLAPYAVGEINIQVRYQII